MGVWEVIKAAGNKTEPQTERKKPNKIVLWIIIIAVAVLAFGKTSGTEKKAEMPEQSSLSEAEFVRGQEEGLEKILKKINGAGDVSVFISIDGGGEKVLARDSKNKYSRESEENAELITDEENEQKIVLSGKGSAAEPYIIEERRPEITGVIVVAEGAADEKVRLEIYEAVKALYGMSPHRIKVTY